MFACEKSHASCTLPFRLGKQLCKKVGLDLDFYVTRERDEEEVFPWEIIDQGIRRDYFWLEYQRALKGIFTPRCASGCRRCGVCG